MQIYAIPLGGFTTRQAFTASGSGSTFVMGFMDKQWKKGMNLEEVKNVSIVTDSVIEEIVNDVLSGLSFGIVLRLY